MSLITRSLERAEHFQESARIDAREAARSGAAGGGLSGRALSGRAEDAIGRRGPSMGNVIANTPGAATNLTFGRYSQTNAHHADQYGYFNGYPYAIINNISNRLAAQPIRVGRVLPRGTRPGRGFGVKSVDFLPKSLHDMAAQIEVFPDHRILRAIRNPNPMMTGHNLQYVTAASKELTGFGYWWMFADDEGRDQIWPVPTFWITPVHEENKLYAYYQVQLPGTGKPIKVPTRQIVPFIHPDPSDPFAALAPLQANARTVMTDFAFEMAQRMSMENGINPGLAIMVGKPPEFAGVGGDQWVLNKDQRDQITQAVKRQYRGVTRFDEPLILDGLIKDVKQISTSPREMAFKESGVLIRNRMTQGFSMNPITLGEMEGVNYASSGAADHHVCRSVFSPRTEADSQTLTCYVPPYLAPDEPGIVVYQEPVQPIDPEMEMSKEYGDYDRGIRSRNDIRQKRGMTPIRNGDRALTSTGWVGVQIDDGSPAKRRPAGGHKGGRQSRQQRKRAGRKLVDGSGHEHGQDGRFGHGGGSGGGGSATKPARHDTGSVNDAPADHDARAKKIAGKIKKYGTKAVAAARAVGKKAYELALHAQWALQSAKISADDIADTSTDYSKINNAKGTGDWLSTHLGVSGNTAAVVASHVLAFGIVKLKKAIAERRAKRDAGKAAGVWARGNAKKKKRHLMAKAVCDIVHRFYPPMGCPADQLPTVAEVEAWLKKRDKAARAIGRDVAAGRVKEKPGRPWGWFFGGHWDTIDRRIVNKAASQARERAFVKRAAVAIDEVQQDAEDATRAGLQAVFAKLGGDAARRLREYAAGQTHVSPSDAAHAAVNRAEWDRELTAALTPILYRAALTGATTEWTLYKSQVGAKSAAAAKSWVGRRLGQIAGDVTRAVLDRGIVGAIIDGTMKAVRRTVRREIADGATPEEAAGKAADADLVGQGAEKAADRVARNDAAQVVNEGQAGVRDSLARAGKVAASEWVTAADEKVRPTHRAMHGKRVRPGKAFQFRHGVEAYYPGDPQLPIGERANCRCKSVTVYVPEN